ncbi:MAG: triose-phosphate isomerase [Geobacteraceae bacterium GWC2_48_7]|nr:MAG: triose-phosphate isomerase [Geobacteraceae bacterium GWC2_48_7]
MRRAVIAGNWKLFKTVSEAAELVNNLKPLVAANSSVDIVVAPVFTSLSKVADALSGSNIKLSAQNCYWEEEGAFTGEVSPKLIKDVGCDYVIIGHSERRQYFGETDESVKKKTGAAITAGLNAIVCVGETLAERESGATFKVIQKQVSGALAGFSPAEFRKIIVAYEPVWAIGTGKTASTEQAQEVHAFIRSLLLDISGAETADSIRILYGGSVKPDNVKSLMVQDDIDGALVGGASLQPESFAAIANFSL